MANFGDSRFGFSSRTLWVSVAVLGVVVGLFFIPALINGQFGQRSADRSAARRAALQQQARQGAQSAPESSRQEPSQQDRASLDAAALKKLNATIEDASPTPVPQQTRLRDVKPSRSSEGLFSGFRVDVSARGNNGADVKDFTLEQIDSRDAQKVFRKGRSDVMRFLDKNPIGSVDARQTLYSLIGAMDFVANGIGKNVSPKEVAAHLSDLHGATLANFAASGVDRGTLLEWLEIPAIKAIEEYRGGDNAQRLLQSFSPRIALKNLSVRQRPGYDEAYGRRTAPMVTAEFSVKGNDVDRIAFYIGGVRERDVKPGRAVAGGYRNFRLRGPGFGMWTIVAYDKYGSHSFTKNYSFFPRVRRFRQLSDGTFEIAFTPRSAPNSLDRFFAVSQSVPAGSRDPAIGRF